MNKSTGELLNEAAQTGDISRFLQRNEGELLAQTVPDYLNTLRHQKDMKIAQIIEGSQRGDYVYKVFRGERPANRDLLVCVSLAMGLNLDEAQALLRVARFSSLDPRDKRDSVVIFCLAKGATVMQMNEVLQDLELETF